MRVRIEAARPQQLRVRLVRSGRLAAEKTGMTPLVLSHSDADIRPGQRVYYRLLVNSQSDRLVSNPIFIEGMNP